jgi:hypothetical protein
MWNWSRVTMADWAPFSTLATVVIAALSVWRFAVSDMGGGAALLLFTAVAALYSALGWHYRRRRPDDPWQPW